MRLKGPGAVARAMISSRVTAPGRPSRPGEATTRGRARPTKSSTSFPVVRLTQMKPSTEAR